MNVAVIIATCGDETWQRVAVERALPSAAAMTRGHFEWPVLIDHYPDLGVAEARNRLARQAESADWLCFLDADDELEYGYLTRMERRYQELLMETAVHDTEPLLVPKLRRVREGRRITSADIATIPNQGRWPAVNEAVIGTLVHRRLFEMVGGFRTHTDDGTPLAMYEDWDLWLRCWNSGARLVYTTAIYREYVSAAGRNTNPSEAERVYAAIWADHLRDREVLGLVER